MFLPATLFLFTGRSGLIVARETHAMDQQRFDAAVEQAKLDAMKELAYGASHEINNPLANIAGRAQTLLKQEHDPSKRKALEAIHRQAMRAHEMISDLMLFARPPAIERSTVDVGTLLTKIREELQGLADEREIAISLSLPSDAIKIDADVEHLGVALRALVENSLEAIGKDGEVALSAEIAGTDVVVAVRDTGPGVPPEVREHLFDPFYSGREAGRGLGFGLSKCWRIVTDHGGTISVESPPAQGAVFTVRLPIAS